MPGIAAWCWWCKGAWEKAAALAKIPDSRVLKLDLVRAVHQMIPKRITTVAVQLITLMVLIQIDVSI